jgi:hypothetical protein
MNMKGLWCIYDHPKDYPDAFVARWWEFNHGCAYATGHCLSANTLKELRSHMRAAGHSCLPRWHMDDAVIIEVWV